jgi:hypothetical protein
VRPRCLADAEAVEDVEPLLWDVVAACLEWSSR